MTEPIIFKSILNDLHQGVFFVEPDRKISFWNKTAEKITGYSAGEVIGRFCFEDILNHVDKDGRKICQEGCLFEQTLRDGSSRESEIYLQHKNGDRLPMSIKVMPVRDEENKIMGAVEVFSDNSKIQEARQRIQDLEKLALLDQITGLPNRRYMEMLLTSRFEEYQRVGALFGILYMDIDLFKNINDDYGHEVGDKVLYMIGQAIKLNSRPYDIAGRWGGDEFLGVIVNVDFPILEKVSERYRVLIKQSCCETGIGSLEISISIGSTLVQKNETIHTLLERADRLLYESKDRGRDRVTCK